MTIPGKLTIIEQEAIETMQPLVAEFLDKVLDLDAAQCIVTDLSSRPTSRHGLPDDAVSADATYGQTLDAWDLWVSDRVEELFGVRPSHTSDTLVVLLAAIQAHRDQRLQ